MPNHYVGDLLHTIGISGLSRVSVWACGPLNLMKISSSQMQNGTGSERRDRVRTGEVEAVRVSGPERAWLSQ
jgi:hypothetical protein